MPKLNDPTMEVIKTGSNYNFSAVKIDQLGATEYSLCLVVLDKSGSLSGYDRDLEKMIQEVVKSCQKSPRAENLMLRVVTFSSQEDEMHGYRLLETISPDDYAQKIITGGQTLLFDTVYHGIEATLAYAKILSSQDYLVNAVVFVVTDGMDNESTYSAMQIKDIVEKAKTSEVLESLAIVLVGMNGDSGVQSYLDDFKNTAQINEYIDLGNVSAGKLAKLAQFVSRSISSTSVALGSGGPSKSLKI